MKEKRAGKKKKGNALIIAGVLLLAAALLFVAYNYWDSERAGRASDAVVDKMDQYIESLDADPDAAVESAQMPTISINGYKYIGELEIEGIDHKLPVMADWSMERLRTSPCRYSGSYYNDDMVVLGHNYAKHFSPLKWIDVGADVYFTNVEGLRIHYVVENRETVASTDVEKMIENDKNDSGSADWDLTLFTCTTGGQARCAVRCVRADDETEQNS